MKGIVVGNIMEKDCRASFSEYFCDLFSRLYVNQWSVALDHFHVPAILSRYLPGGTPSHKYKIAYTFEYLLHTLNLRICK